MRGIMILSNYFEDTEALTTLDVLRRANLEVDTVSVVDGKMITTQSKVVIYSACSPHRPISVILSVDT